MLRGPAERPHRTLKACPIQFPSFGIKLASNMGPDLTLHARLARLIYQRSVDGKLDGHATLETLPTKAESGEEEFDRRD